MVKEFEEFINIINFAIYNKEIPEDKIREYDWESVLEEARVHNCWAIVFPAIKKIQEKYHAIDDNLYLKWKNVTMMIATKQCAKNYELSHVIKLLEDNDIKVAIFKGVVMAKLYPEYLLRYSGDADIFVNKKDMNKLTDLLLKDGFVIDEKASKSEVPVFEKKGVLVLEVHSSLWEERISSKIAILDSMNLTDVEKRYRFYGCDVVADTFGYTEQLIYVIYHMAKHFIPAGVGIRHLLDLTLYINKYFDKLDLIKLNFCINKLGYTKLCNCIFKICVRYLGMTRKILQGKDASITELEEIVLDDIREAGVFGGRTKERRKSSNVIVQTYYEQDGKSTSKFKVMLNTMFPSAENLSDRYVNAKKYKILLPVAWSQRVLFHFKEKSKNKNEPDLFKKASLVEERLRLLEKLDLKN